MPAHEYGSRQVIKPFPFFVTITAAFLLSMVIAALVDFVGRTGRASYSVEPMFMSDFFVTFVFVYNLRVKSSLHFNWLKYNNKIKLFSSLPNWTQTEIYNPL
jgi:hypothetical protein